MLSYEYVAGLVDGEGCIRLTPSGEKRYLRYYPRLQVTNTYVEVLVMLKEQFGGYIGKPKRRPDSTKDCFDWRIDGDGARSLLHNLLPFLVIKREKALAVLAGDQKGQGKG